MYTHIGNEKIIKTKNIIGVFDIKTLSVSRENKRLLLDVKGQEQSSIILLESDNEENKYELSNIAVSTLKKRLEKSIFN